MSVQINMESNSVQFTITEGKNFQVMTKKRDNHFRRSIWFYTRGYPIKPIYIQR